MVLFFTDTTVHLILLFMYYWGKTFLVLPQSQNATEYTKIYVHIFVIQIFLD